MCEVGGKWATGELLPSQVRREERSEGVHHQQTLENSGTHQPGEEEKGGEGGGGGGRKRRRRRRRRRGREKKEEGRGEKIK